MAGDGSGAPGFMDPKYVEDPDDYCRANCALDCPFEVSPYWFCGRTTGCMGVYVHHCVRWRNCVEDSRSTDLDLATGFQCYCSCVCLLHVSGCEYCTPLAVRWLNPLISIIAHWQDTWGNWSTFCEGWCTSATFESLGLWEGAWKRAGGWE